MIRIFYPHSTYKLLDALSQHKVYVAGGFVRDMLRSGHGGEFSHSAGVESVFPDVTDSCATRLESVRAGTQKKALDPGSQETLSQQSCQVFHRVREDSSDFATTPRPKDIDLVTADPLEKFLPTVQKLSPKHHIMQHYQAVQFSFEGYQVTLTRLRYDASCDGRQAEIVFVDTLQEDVWRRDFTINALYADCDGQVIDFLGGAQDLEQKIVRFIGDPKTRIKEDLLRILRYVRFCSLLKAPMDPHVLDLMRPYVQELQSLPPERLQHEIKKIRKLPSGQDNLARLKI